MLTGINPPHAFDLLNGNPLSFPNYVRPALRAVITHAMAPLRMQRYQSVAEMLNALNATSGPDDAPIHGNPTIPSDATIPNRPVMDVKVIDVKPEPIIEPQPKPKPQPNPSGKTKKVIGALVACFAVILLVWFGYQKSHTISEPSGYIKDYGYVDLGLSVKWATCNVGASSPEEYGNYYAWGETSTKTSYTSDNSKTYGKSMGDIGGNATYDAARANWGGSWRLPTKAEFQELIDNCTWTWTTQGGKKGYKVTSKENGASIFLPAAGSRYGTSLDNDGQYGRYWTSTPYDSNTYDAYYLYFYSSDRDTRWDVRGYGRSVRPVSE